MFWIVYSRTTCTMDLAWGPPTEWQLSIYRHVSFGRFPLCNDEEELA